MSPPPNEVYTVFSFIGFVLCFIPFYPQFQSWNTGTCLFMAWVGLGCLFQCINSIVWNKNIVDRAPFYCDFSTRFQVALNTAVPACSLCINRRLYKIATVKAVMTTHSDKRRVIIQDLLIGIGLPILQILANYVVSSNRYVIFEDFGPQFNIWNMVPTFFLFYAWPVVIGTISFFYCSMSIYSFYHHQRQFREMMSFHTGLNRSRYFRLMAISATDMLVTTPLATYYLVDNARQNIVPWKSWADTHSHYSSVIQVPGFIWKNDPYSVIGLELSRWTLVFGAFLFFALFGLAGESCQGYSRFYTTATSRIGYSTSTLQGSSHATSSVTYYLKSKAGVTTQYTRPISPAGRGNVTGSSCIHSTSTQ